MNFLNIKAPETFSKESDVELWLSRFKRYILAQGDRLCEGEIISIFATLLDDECYRLFDSVGFKQSWDENEQTLLALFAKPTMNPHVYLQQFKTRTQRPDENVSQFAAALHDMANKSFGHQIMRGGIENFIKEQFILGLRDQKISDKLKYSHFESLNSLINRAKDYEAMHMTYRGQPRYEPTQRESQADMSWKSSPWLNSPSSTPSIPTPAKREPRYMGNDGTRNRAFENRGNARDGHNAYINHGPCLSMSQMLSSSQYSTSSTRTHSK